MGPHRLEHCGNPIQIVRLRAEPNMVAGLHAGETYALPPACVLPLGAERKAPSSTCEISSEIHRLCIYNFLGMEPEYTFLKNTLLTFFVGYPAPPHVVGSRFF